jgi:tetratricopeptide (TPR) repeat protein
VDTRRAAIAVLALLAGARAEGQADGEADPYRPLLESYARGDRAAALEGLAKLPEKAQLRGYEQIRALAVQAERCPSCPFAQTFLRLPLKAAVMLHLDRDRALNPRSDEVEQPRPCPGWQAWLAARYATLLARWPATRAFARAFFVGMALRCQMDACLEHAQGWCEEGLKLFPRDSALLYGLGSIHEEIHALTTSSVGGLRERHLRDARAAFAGAIEAEGGFALARVRLGRVLWRLGDAEAARASLEASLPRTLDPATLYLARLFLGRVHEDAGRFDEALLQYRHALQLDPRSQAAAVALSHVLRLQGDGPGSRRQLLQGLAHAGRRLARDQFWDYLMSTPVAHPDRVFDEMRRESLQ